MSKPSVSARIGKKGKHTSSKDSFLFSQYTKLILERSTYPLLIIARGDFSILYATASALRIFFKNRASELIGESILKSIPFSDVIFGKNIRLVAEGKSSLRFEYFYENQNSWFMIHIYSIDDFIFISLSDITKWKLTEQAMSELTRKVSHILDSITDAFISFDSEWRYTYVNPQAEKLLGIRWQRLLGTSMYDSFPEVPRSILLGRYPDGGKDEFPARLTVEWTNSRWLHVHVYPSVSGFSVYFTDITEEKLVSERKDEFISVASHELKTPVTSMYSYSQLIKRYFEKKGDEQALRYFSKMSDQITALTRLVTGLLDVTRIQTGKLILDKSEFDLRTVVAECISDCEYLSPHHVFEVMGDFPVRIYADKHRVSEVLINLLTNAVKYSLGANKVIIRIVQDTDRVVVSVQDFGRGIPASDLGRVFDRFYRVKEEGGRRAGIGLGLYIALHIVKEHGGAMWVESEVEKGSTFYFSLPIS